MRSYFDRLKSLTRVACSGIFLMSSQSFSCGKPITLNILSSWSWWYGLLVLISSWRQWNIGSDVSSSAKIHPIAQISVKVKENYISLEFMSNFPVKKIVFYILIAIFLFKWLTISKTVLDNSNNNQCVWICSPWHFYCQWISFLLFFIVLD